MVGFFARVSRNPFFIISANHWIIVTSFYFVAYFDYKRRVWVPKPPSYNVATTLPSYDEAERDKAEATIPLVPGRVSPIYTLLFGTSLWELSSLHYQLCDIT